jgi:uncharacterized OB-fold protein
MSAGKPRPRITPDNRPFWDACRRHRIELPFCADCGKPHLPPGPLCPFCFAGRIEWRVASGRGTISSWTVVHQGWFPAFRSEIPYNVVQVELEEGPRLTANVVGDANAKLRVGTRVEAVFEDVADDLTLPRFRLVE